MNHTADPVGFGLQVATGICRCRAATATTARRHAAGRRILGLCAALLALWLGSPSVAANGPGPPSRAKAYGAPVDATTQRPVLLKDDTAVTGSVQVGKVAYGRTDRPMDVTRYDLDLQLTDVNRHVGGTVAVTLTPLATLDQVVLDLYNIGLSVSAVTVDGTPRPYVHQGDTLSVDLPAAISIGDTVTVAVTYAGTPIRPPGVGFGYDVRQATDADGVPQVPIAATVSEPDGARSWWPCHDTPYDAAQVRLSVTAPDRLVLGSAGAKTEDVLLPGGLRRQTWWMPEPIPAYLVSVALAEYVTWADSATVHRWPGGEAVSMPVEYFAPAYVEAQARAQWANTPAMIETFDRLFGPYPYADLKYGMSVIVFGGAMEHPTLSSMGLSTLGLGGAPLDWAVPHELAHQWFGDCVHLARWGDIWLNEGFASYCEVLWAEEAGDVAGARAHLQAKRRTSFPGTLVDPPQLFGATTYQKGAWVLHMLRQVMGRDGLISAMRAYVTDPALRFGPVTSADFQAHCEQEVGQNLDWFFRPWLTWPGRPHLLVDWEQLAGSVRVTVQQPPDSSYRLPLPLRLAPAVGDSVDVVRWIDGPLTTFDVPMAEPASGIVVDPHSDWLLDVTTGTPTLPPLQVLPAHPNPFNPQVSIPVLARDATTIVADVFDTRGRHVRRLFDRFVAGMVVTELSWDGTDDAGRAVGSGVYAVWVRDSSGHSRVVRATLLR